MACSKNGGITNLDQARDAFVAIESVASLYIAAHLVLSGVITVGMLVSFIAYKRLFITSTITLTELGFRIKAINVHLSRLEDIALAEPERQAPHEQPRSNFLRIELAEVSHRYPNASSPTFKAVSFTAFKGERIALVGASGSGKSTLIKLVLGLLPLEQGSILIDGSPLQDIPRANWLSNVGTVFQGDKLLSGTLLENISFFDSNLDRERAREAAELAHIWLEIERLPMGLNTPIQDDFSILSAGQKQRILLARALYRKPQLLIMDEGTANLDEKVESDILRTIAALNVTVIHATHRPQVIADATRVVYIDEFSQASAPEIRSSSSAQAY